MQMDLEVAVGGRSSSNRHNVLYFAHFCHLYLKTYTCERSSVFRLIRIFKNIIIYSKSLKGNL